MLVRESVDDILKPKPSKKIVEEIAQEIELDLLSGAVSFFEHVDQRMPNKWYVGSPNWNINTALDNYNKEFGSGYYVMSVMISPENIPMDNVFPENRMVAKGTVQYLIPQSQVNELIKELVSLVMIGKLGRGFHIKYFKPKLSENIFSPKSEEDIVNDATENGMYRYDMMHHGLFKGILPMVKKAIEMGQDPNSPDLDALVIAKKLGHVNIVKYLESLK